MSDKPKKTRKRESLVKRYCFTWNNYDDESLGLLKDTFTADNCRYAICGLERGENGTHHIQGYIHLKKAIRFTPFKKMLGGKAHIEKALGSDADNKRYCGKEGNVFLEVGCVADNITERGGKPYSIQRGVEMAKVISTGVRPTKLLTDEEAEATYFMYRRNIHSWQKIYDMRSNFFSFVESSKAADGTVGKDSVLERLIFHPTNEESLGTTTWRETVAKLSLAVTSSAEEMPLDLKMDGQEI